MQSSVCVDTSIQVLEADRRKESREKCDPPRAIHLFAKPQLGLIEAHIRNFSPRGLGIVTDRPFTTGTLLAVQRQRGQLGLTGMLTAKVRHVAVLPDGQWLLGCSLSRQLTNEELTNLRMPQGYRSVD
jgi:hypothetical protein